MREKVINRGLALAGMTWSLFYCLSYLWFTYKHGGDPWAQGEWLINNEATLVRRGVVGSSLIALADDTHHALLDVVLAVQVSLVVSIYGTMLWLVSRMEEIPDRLLMVLLSPAALMFWGYAWEAIGRKEMLAYLAFLPLLVAAHRGRSSTATTALTVALFTNASIAHEGNVFFLPFLASLLFLVEGDVGDRQRAIKATVAMVLVTAATLAFALANNRVSNFSPVCQPLLDHGLAPVICEGAIRWLKLPLDVLMSASLARLKDVAFWIFLAFYGILLLPFFMFARFSPDRRRWLHVMLWSSLCFLPLYASAMDWGRWMTYHLTALSLGLLGYALLRKPDWARVPLPVPAYVLFLVLSLSTGAMVIFGIPQGGVVQAAAAMVWPQSAKSLGTLPIRMRRGTLFDADSAMGQALYASN